ncbi:hypothetical protein HYV86_03730 [Candidatus Woesearchaeota archaeon]|nr:hypothetical protein [Candidatus Woesearchaeota archaeon]
MKQTLYSTLTALTLAACGGTAPGVNQSETINDTQRQEAIASLQKRGVTIDETLSCGPFTNGFGENPQPEGNAQFKATSSYFKDKGENLLRTQSYNAFKISLTQDRAGKYHAHEIGNTKTERGLDSFARFVCYVSSKPSYTKEIEGKELEDGKREDGKATYGRLVREMDQKFSAAVEESDRRFDEAVRESDRRFDDTLRRSNERFDELREKNRQRFEDTVKRNRERFNETRSQFDEEVEATSDDSKCNKQYLADLAVCERSLYEDHKKQCADRALREANWCKEFE